MNDLSNLSPASGSTRPRKRRGRGPGSGLGKTCGRGVKGQKSRSGGKIAVGFEGGQMPLTRRLPKRGFTNNFASRVAIVNLGDISKAFEGGAVVDEAALREKSLLSGRWDAIKVLAKGEIDKALTFKLHRFSKSARVKIEEAGGSVEVIGG